MKSLAGVPACDSTLAVAVAAVEQQLGAAYLIHTSTAATMAATMAAATILTADLLVKM